MAEEQKEEDDEQKQVEEQKQEPSSIAITKNVKEERVILKFSSRPPFSCEKTGAVNIRNAPKLIMVRFFFI